MAAMDEFKEEREQMKHAPLKKKLQYFVDYYLLKTVLITVGIICIISYTVHLVTAPEIIMDGIVLNLFSVNDDITPIMNDFLDEQQIDKSKNTISVNSSLSYYTDEENMYSEANKQALDLIYAQAASGTLDFLTGDDFTMTDLAYRGLLADLRDHLSDEQIAEYEPYFLYMDRTTYETIQEASANYEDTSLIPIPDCSKPEDMEDPIPIFIDMSVSQKISEAYTYNSETPVFAIAACCKNTELTCSLLDYLMAE